MAGEKEATILEGMGCEGGHCLSMPRSFPKAVWRRLWTHVSSSIRGPAAKGSQRVPASVTDRQEDRRTEAFLLMHSSACPLMRTRSKQASKQASSRTSKPTNKHFDFDSLCSRSYSEHNPASAWLCHNGSHNT